jgi:hypothetical protein
MVRTCGRATRPTALCTRPHSPATWDCALGRARRCLLSAPSRIPYGSHRCDRLCRRTRLRRSLLQKMLVCVACSLPECLTMEELGIRRLQTRYLR